MRYQWLVMVQLVMVQSTGLDETHVSTNIALHLIAYIIFYRGHLLG